MEIICSTAPYAWCIFKTQHFRSIGVLRYVSDRKTLHFGFYYGEQRQGKR